MKSDKILIILGFHTWGLGMKKNFSIGFKLSTLFVFLATTGCAEYHRRVLGDMEARGPEFTRVLAEEYCELGTIEEDIMYDECSANYYFLKAICAKEGRYPPPTILENWDIHPDKMPELATARQRLMRAMQLGASTVAPRLAAHAQTHFDCWVEQQSEGWQKEDISSCRHEFYKAIAEVELMLKGGAHKVTPAHSVLFNNNSSHLTHEAIQIVDAVAIDAKSRHILLVGRTDKVGDVNHNKDLSKQRAAAVKKELVRRGMSPHLITIKAEGETPGPKVDTHNRRVDIIFLDSQ